MTAEGEGVAEGAEQGGAEAAEADLLAHPRVHARSGTLPVAAPRRIVSLVPSLSEALVVLGLGDRVVGVTEYCVAPPGAFDGTAKVGGTKDADVEAIASLAPDLVLANHEENTARVVRQLAERGLDVWVTYPRTVREGAELLAAVAGLGASDAARRRHVDPCLEAVAAAEAARAADRAAGRRPPRVFCPIWRDPWMTIGGDTYVHDMLVLCGGDNLFATAGDRRYPIVELAAVEAADPEVILLPDEPWAFAEADARELGGLDCAAARAGRIHLIDGALVSWYGPRIAEAIQVLAPIIAGR